MVNPKHAGRNQTRRKSNSEQAFLINAKTGYFTENIRFFYFDLQRIIKNDIHFKFDVCSFINTLYLILNSRILPAFLFFLFANK